MNDVHMQISFIHGSGIIHRELNFFLELTTFGNLVFVFGHIGYISAKRNRYYAFV